MQCKLFFKNKNKSGRMASFYKFANIFHVWLNRKTAGFSYLLLHSICYRMSFWLSGQRKFNLTQICCHNREEEYFNNPSRSFWIIFFDTLLKLNKWSFLLASGNEQYESLLFWNHIENFLYCYSKVLWSALYFQWVFYPCMRNHDWSFRKC